MPPPQRTQYTTLSMWTNVQCEVPILFSYHACSTALIYCIKRGGSFLKTGTNQYSWPYLTHEEGSFWPIWPTSVRGQLTGDPRARAAGDWGHLTGGVGKWLDSVTCRSRMVSRRCGYADVPSVCSGSWTPSRRHHRHGASRRCGWRCAPWGVPVRWTPCCRCSTWTASVRRVSVDVSSGNSPAWTSCCRSHTCTVCLPSGCVCVSWGIAARWMSGDTRRIRTAAAFRYRTFPDFWAKGLSHHMSYRRIYIWFALSVGPAPHLQDWTSHDSRHVTVLKQDCARQHHQSSLTQHQSDNSAVEMRLWRWSPHLNVVLSSAVNKRVFVAAPLQPVKQRTYLHNK